MRYEEELSEGGQLNSPSQENQAIRGESGMRDSFVFNHDPGELPCQLLAQFWYELLALPKEGNQ